MDCGRTLPMIIRSRAHLCVNINQSAKFNEILNIRSEMSCSSHERIREKLEQFLTEHLPEYDLRLETSRLVFA